MIGYNTYRHTGSWEGFIKYDIEMGSDAMIYIPRFIKICSGIQKLLRGYTQTQREDGDHISLLYENRLKRLKPQYGGGWPNTNTFSVGFKIHVM
jgi:hypothetical protein